MVELNDQNFYYRDLRGRLLGNKAREQLIVEEVAKLERNEFFLEVGCAQGHFEGIARRFSQNVFGGDFAFEKLPLAKKNFPGCRFVGINAERLPFKSNSFDFVLCTEVLEHVPKWRLALKELQRVSRKRVLVTVPLEKGFFWKVLSKFRGMQSRGHLHMLDSLDLEAGLGRGWKAVKRKIVATPSRRLNRLLGNGLGERLAMYSMLLFEKRS